MTLRDDIQPTLVHQLFFDGQVALPLAEVARITRTSELTLLQMGRATLYGSPPPKLRFCIKAPIGFDVYKIAPKLANNLSSLLQNQPEGVGHANLPARDPEFFEKFDYLVLSPEDCTALCNRGHVDVSIFRNGIVFDGINIPRSLPFEDPSSQYHRVLALSKTPTEFSGHYKKAPFCLARITITKDDLFILVSDLSFVTDLHSISNQDTQANDVLLNFRNTTLSDSDTLFSKDFSTKETDSFPVAQENPCRESIHNRKITLSEAISHIESEHMPHASNDLKSLLESSKEAWGKDFRRKGRYPTNAEVVTIIQNKFKEKKLLIPADKPADYLARLIRPKNLPRIPDDTTEIQRNGQYVNTDLLALFEASTERSKKNTEKDLEEHRAISTYLKTKHQIPEYIADVGARTILGKFSQPPKKSSTKIATHHKSNNKPTPTSPLEDMTMKSYKESPR